MNERDQIVLYTIAASALLFIAVRVFMGAADGDVQLRPGAGSPSVQASVEAAPAVTAVEASVLEPDVVAELGDRAPLPPTRAFDLMLEGCDEVRTVGVDFRYGTVAIKGATLNRIDSLIARSRECSDSLFSAMALIAANEDIDGDELRATRRLEELEDYLLRRGVSRKAIRLADDS